VGVSEQFVDRYLVPIRDETTNNNQSYVITFSLMLVVLHLHYHHTVYINLMINDNNLSDYAHGYRRSFSQKLKLTSILSNCAESLQMCITRANVVWNSHAVVQVLPAFKTMLNLFHYILKYYRGIHRRASLVCIQMYKPPPFL